MFNKISEYFAIPVTPPFRLDFSVWALKRRPNNYIDLWDENKYSRVFVIKDIVFKVEIIQQKNTELKIRVISRQKIDNVQTEIVQQLKNMLGLQINLNDFYEMAFNDKYLKHLVNKFIGIKPPRFPSIFEAMINAISCQQLTLNFGILLLNRLAQNYGKKFEDEQAITFAFPRPIDLKDILIEDMKKLGFSYNKARAIKELAISIVDQKMDLTIIEKMTDDELIRYLSNIRGIGRWSSEYVLLRGFGRINVFPGDDVGAQKNIKELFNLNEKPSYEKIKKLTSHWNPHAGMVYFHLLLNRLEKERFL